METPVTVDELRSRLTEIQARQQEIDTTHAGQALPEAEKAEFEQLQEEKHERQRTIAELEQRAAWIAENAKDPATSEAGAQFNVQRSGPARGEDIYDMSTVRSSMSNPAMQSQELRDRAMRSVDTVRLHGVDDPARSKGCIEQLVEGQDDQDPRFSRYLLATGSPAYRRAFGKYLQRGNENGMARDEQAAWQQGMQAERALSLTGSAGGFAVPYFLDPTILNTSNGVVNPIREIARVVQITVDEWRGVTSTGITASYQAEATETTDNAPTLAAPVVSTEKAQAFVPFSIEVGQDWSTLQGEMALLLTDAKDTLEAGKFITGTGTNEPFGVLTGTTNTVAASAGQTFTLANLYSLIASLPPRFRANGAFLGDLQILNRVRQFDTVGSSAAIWADNLTIGLPATLLGKPAYEASEMPDAPSTGSKFMLFGDFSRYLIVDRVGLTVEVIPHLMGINRRPTGERGLYAYWRNGAKVLDPNAFRALVGTV